jgi:hypothetical protein
VLLGLDMFALKVFIRPPWFAAAPALASFGKQLVAIVLQGVKIDKAGLNRPKAPAASFVPQINIAIGGADEQALPWLYHLQSPIARPVALHGTRDKRFEFRRFGLAHGVHFGDLDQPFARRGSS